jgi:hypothetical protein
MADNRPLDTNFDTAAYNSHVASINYEYCKKFNYDFTYYRPYLHDRNSLSLYNCYDENTGGLRYAAWAKLLATKVALNLGYDYVVYIDSDCIFRNFDVSIEDFIKPYLDKNVIFLENIPFDEDHPCSGFYVCKVNSETKHFITEWYATNIPDKNTIHAWEQVALHQIYKNYNLAVVKKAMMFYEEPNQFLRHISSGLESHTYRFNYFRDFIEANNIDYKKNIENIVFVEFNTVDYYKKD